MSETIAFPLPSGPNYTIPDVGDENWGQNVTNFLVALPLGVVPTAGTFTLTGDLSFGSSYGLVAKYLTSLTSNPSQTGFLKLAKTDTLSWRNNANSADLPLAINGSNQLTFNGFTLTPGNGVVNSGTQYQLAYYATSTNAVNGLTLITPNSALESDANGLPIASSVSSTTLGYLDATSSIQTQLNSLQAQINAAVQVPLGATIRYPSATPPSSSYVLANGQAISRATYSAYFALVGTTFGAGNGTTTFNVPNEVDNFPVGAGNLYAVGATGGAVSHTLTAAELPASIPVIDPGHNHTQNAHTHTINDSGHTHQEIAASGGAGADSGIQSVSTNSPQGTPTNAVTGSSMTGVTNNNTTPTNNSNTTGITVGGSGTSHSILNPYLAQYWHVRVL